MKIVLLILVLGLTACGKSAADQFAEKKMAAIISVCEAETPTVVFLDVKAVREKWLKDCITKTLAGRKP